MRQMIPGGLALATTLALGCGSGPAPVPPDEMLPFGSDTIATLWEELPIAAPVADRFAVVSAPWDSAGLTQFSRHALEPLGRARSGAYQHPFEVFSFRDTVFLSDWGKRRTTVWTQDGSLVDSIPVPDRLRGAYPRARDGAGNLYFQVEPPAGRDGSGNQDSAAVVRGNPGLTRFDTVARLAPLELAQVRRDNQVRFERRVFSGSDLWGVWPDGAVWIARRFRNQLVTVDPRGAITRGPELPDPVFEVTTQDRLEYLYHYPEEVRPHESDVAWAIIHPPFVAAFTAPDGTVWLEKSKQAADSIRRIHVLDRTGNLRRVLLLKGPGTLLAVGASDLLIGVRGPKGVDLSRVRIPSAGSRPSPAP